METKKIEEAEEICQAILHRSTRNGPPQRRGQRGYSPSSRRFPITDEMSCAP